MVIYIITISAASQQTCLHVNVRQFQVERLWNEIQCSSLFQQLLLCVCVFCVYVHVCAHHLSRLSDFTKIQFLLQTESEDSLGKRSNIDLWSRWRLYAYQPFRHLHLSPFATAICNVILHYFQFFMYKNVSSTCLQSVCAVNMLYITTTESWRKGASLWMKSTVYICVFLQGTEIKKNRTLKEIKSLLRLIRIIIHWHTLRSYIS